MSTEIGVEGPIGPGPCPAGEAGRPGWCGGRCDHAACHRARATASMLMASVAIEEAANVTDSEAYDALVLKLSTHPYCKTIVTGVGKSAIAARKIAATLATCGQPAMFVDPIGLYHGELGMLVKGDVVVMVSHSGRTEELVRLIPVLEKKGCDVYSIISRGDSELGRDTRAMITGVEREPFLKIPTASSAAAVAVGDALAIEIALRRGYDENAFAANHPGGTIGKAYQA